MSSWWAHKDVFFDVRFFRSRGSEDGPPRGDDPWSYTLEAHVYKRLFCITVDPRRGRKTMLENWRKGYVVLFGRWIDWRLEDEWFYQDTNCDRNR